MMITLKGIIDEDFVNYKVPSMTLMFPYCDFKCDKECGQSVCQNSQLISEPEIQIDAMTLCQRYMNNPITHAVVIQGLEPFDSLLELHLFIATLRHMFYCDDPIVIYTGYNKSEIIFEVSELQKYKNIIIKYGRYIPKQKPHYDEVLGVKLASDNQYAERIS